ncbi:DUF4870 domain-containing protein [Mucilaginibacter sp. JRF]|uniref:DUF4870 domain-containing protein n=1 Tax=Mucilaginibacter sp. JRF TaxID=2780088 RepID=UPI00187DDE67|nr:DUF4870 domain-containing protein [Mucilaginibacter sp. JRF]MBE9585134.1 DUF4870 domain-containing protein [Mucilaginibacter sp. JRF]
MTNKSMAIVAYITIIGWVISYLEYKKRADKSALVNYHLGQSLGLIILSFVLGIVISVLVAVVPSLYFISLAVTLISLILLLLGIVTANNEAIKPLPVVGKLFEGKFDFTK